MRRAYFSLRRQRGYLYLSTGANGTGKTLFTLADVRALQVATNRPVFFKGFTAKQPLLDFGWIEHDMKDWQSLPDGSICVWDECQDEITSLTADKATDYERKILSEHRKRGFDFFFLTQHPMNMGAFIRRAVATPGWHRHFKASTIALNSNELKWSAVNTQPEKPNSGASGTVTSRTHPKEVYAWYESTVGDTATRSIPKRVWVAIGAVILAAAMIYGAVWWFKKSFNLDDSAKDKPKAVATAPASAATTPAKSSADEKRSMTAAEYAASFTPRIAGLEFTASRYDAFNVPKTAPRPAACLDGTKRGAKGRTCKCWSQQATILQVPEQLCRQIVAGGYFDDTRDMQQVAMAVAPASVAGPVLAQPAESQAVAFNAGSVLPPLETRSTVTRDSEVLAFMAKRREFK